MERQTPETQKIENTKQSPKRWLLMENDSVYQKSKRPYMSRLEFCFLRDRLLIGTGRDARLRFEHTRKMMRIIKAEQVGSLVDVVPAHQQVFRQLDDIRLYVTLGRRTCLKTDNRPEIARRICHFGCAIGYCRQTFVMLQAGYSFMVGTPTMDYVKGGSHNMWNDWAFISLNVNPRVFNKKW